MELTHVREFEPRCAPRGPTLFPPSPPHASRSRGLGADTPTGTLTTPPPRTLRPHAVNRAIRTPTSERDATADPTGRAASCSSPPPSSRARAVREGSTVEGESQVADANPPDALGHLGVPFLLKSHHRDGIRTPASSTADPSVARLHPVPLLPPSSVPLPPRGDGVRDVLRRGAELFLRRRILRQRPGTHHARHLVRLRLRASERTRQRPPERAEREAREPEPGVREGSGTEPGSGHDRRIRGEGRREAARGRRGRRRESLAAFFPVFACHAMTTPRG